MLTLHIACSSTSDIAFSIMWGSILALYWNALPHSLLSILYKVFHAAALTLCMALPLQLLLLAADMAGTMHWSELRPILPDVLATHAGSVLLSQFICVFLTSLSSLLPLGPWSRRSFSSALLLALTTFKATAGHAASDGTFSLREIAQWLHLVSIASWAGGILLAAWFILPHLDRESSMPLTFLRRLSFQCTLFLALVFLSGASNTWLVTEGQLAPLSSSTWGTLLIVKIAFVLFALRIGFQNRRDIQGELTTSTQAVVIKRIRLEALVMLVILCASGWLSNLSPT